MLHSSITGGEPPKEPEPWEVIELSYDELGRLTSILVRQQPRPPQFRDESVEVAYQRPPGTLKRGELLQLVVTRLTEQIPLLFRTYRVNEPAYCLALWWSPEQFASLPPSIGVGLESQRMAWAEGSAGEVRSCIWNPAEFRHFGAPALELDDPELIRACELLNQEANQRADDGSIERVLLATATALNRYPWADAFPITDDFVVFAVASDEDFGQTLRRIRASAPGSVYKQLRARKWV